MAKSISKIRIWPCSPSWSRELCAGNLVNEPIPWGQNLAIDPLEEMAGNESGSGGEGG